MNYYDEFCDLNDCGLALACTALLLNLPIGLIALIYALQGLAFIRAKDHNRAEYCSYYSKRISIAAIATGLIAIISTLAYIVLI